MVGTACFANDKKVHLPNINRTFLRRLKTETGEHLLRLSQGSSLLHIGIGSRRNARWVYPLKIVKNLWKTIIRKSGARGSSSGLCRFDWQGTDWAVKLHYFR